MFLISWAQYELRNLKYLVYNARKRGADKASEYFKRTENIAGVKDMRFQALMPDILHWLGIKKIDRMLSMSKCVSHSACRPFARD
jgi:GTP cyclohydrolase II